MLSLLVSWLYLDRGFCNDADIMNVGHANSQNQENVKYYSSGVFMHNGVGYIVIDDHVLHKSPDFSWSDKPEPGNRVWFRQNRSGDVVDIILNRRD